MREITKYLHSYCDAISHLWNTYYYGKVTSLYECGILCKYESIVKLLFSSIVLNEIGRMEFEGDFQHKPLDFMRVSPRLEDSPLRMLVRDVNITGYNAYKDDMVALSKEDVLSFIDVFTWDYYGFVAYQYYKVMIIKCGAKPEYEGREALVEINGTKVIFHDN